MANRRKIGLIFCVDESWAGGFYYLLNLIKALNYLPIEGKPHLVVFYEHENVIEKVQTLNYPFIYFEPIYKRTGWLGKKILGGFKRLGFSNFLQIGNYPKNFVDVVLPYNYYTHFESLSRLNQVYWIPDFQHKFYPQNFNAQELSFREERTAHIIEKNYPLILSSISSRNDFRRFYPHSTNKIYELPFCSMLSDFSPVSWDGIERKYNIKGPYFISPNQFWKHKNHSIILKAANILNKKGVGFYIIFTGNELGNEEYVRGLRSYVQENNLEDHVSFLGFLDRNVQLTLVQKSKAVIQPSLFEGWSTVVEDAKALGKYVIASSIEVHKEQLATGGTFFDPSNEFELANILEENWSQPTLNATIDYNSHIISFAHKIAAVE